MTRKKEKRRIQKQKKKNGDAESKKKINKKWKRLGKNNQQHKARDMQNDFIVYLFKELKSECSNGRILSNTVENSEPRALSLDLFAVRIDTVFVLYLTHSLLKASTDGWPGWLRDARCLIIMSVLMDFGWSFRFFSFRCANNKTRVRKYSLSSANKSIPRAIKRRWKIKNDIRISETP